MLELVAFFVKTVILAIHVIQAKQW